MDCIAILYYWNGTTEELKIKREWVDDIVDAVRGQYTYVDKATGLFVVGGNIKHIEVYEDKEC